MLVSSSIDLRDCVVPSAKRITEDELVYVTLVDRLAGAVLIVHEGHVVLRTALEVPRSPDRFDIEDRTLIELYTCYRRPDTDIMALNAAKHVIAQIVSFGAPVYDSILFTPDENMFKMLEEYVNQPVRAYMTDPKMLLPSKPKLKDFTLETYGGVFEYSEFVEPDREEFDKKVQAAISSGRNFALRKLHPELRDPKYIEEQWEKHRKRAVDEYDAARMEAEAAYTNEQEVLQASARQAYDDAVAEWEEKKATRKEYFGKLEQLASERRIQLMEKVTKALDVRRAECLL